MLITTEVLDKPRISINPCVSTPSQTVSLSRILGSGQPIYDIKPILASSNRNALDDSAPSKKIKRKNSVVTEIHTIPFIFNDVTIKKKEFRPNFLNNENKYPRNDNADGSDKQVSRARIFLAPSNGQDGGVSGQQDGGHNSTKLLSCSPYLITATVTRPCEARQSVKRKTGADTVTALKEDNEKKNPNPKTCVLNEQNVKATTSKSFGGSATEPGRLKRFGKSNENSGDKKHETELKLNVAPRSEARSKSPTYKLTSPPPRVQVNSVNLSSILDKKTLPNEHISPKRDDNSNNKESKFLKFGRHSFRRNPNKDKRKISGETEEQGSPKKRGKSADRTTNFRRKTPERKSLKASKLKPEVTILSDDDCKDNTGASTSKIEQLKADLNNSSLGVLNTPPKSRSNSIFDPSQKNSRNNSICSRNNSKRPSVSLNVSFINELRKRNNSITNGEVLTRSNSLTSLVNHRPNSRHGSVSKKNKSSKQSKKR